ncbi:hypothetical protein F5X99DRAFT_400603 [Biscogniauxia marginata]|nr:hypothetical protein F5X99DRAFT_400603 [Biscogniauxia marginata]
MVDSRTFRTNTPVSLHGMQTWVYKPLLPLFQLLDSTIRTAAPAGVNVVEVAVSPTYVGERGFFTLLKKRLELARKQWPRKAAECMEADSEMGSDHEGEY